MSDFQRKFSMENYRMESALKVARRNATTTDFDIPMGSWEQTTQERSKWRGLINKGAPHYKEKRICESPENAKTRPTGHQQSPLYMQPTVKS